MYGLTLCYMFSATTNQGNRQPVKFGGHRHSESCWEGKWRGGAIGATQMDQSVFCIKGILIIPCCEFAFSFL